MPISSAFVLDDLYMSAWVFSGGQGFSFSCACMYSKKSLRASMCSGWWGAGRIGVFGSPSLVLKTKQQNQPLHERNEKSGILTVRNRRETDIPCTRPRQAVGTCAYHLPRSGCAECRFRGDLAWQGYFCHFVRDEANFAIANENVSFQPKTRQDRTPSTWVFSGYVR